jgi:hypothetical protein
MMKSGSEQGYKWEEYYAAMRLDPRNPTAFEDRCWSNAPLVRCKHGVLYQGHEKPDEGCGLDHTGLCVSCPYDVWRWQDGVYAPAPDYPHPPERASLEALVKRQKELAGKAWVSGKGWIPIEEYMKSTANTTSGW